MRARTALAAAALLLAAPAPPQGLYFVAATYPDSLYADEAEEAHAGAERA